MLLMLDRAGEIALPAVSYVRAQSAGETSAPVAGTAGHHTQRSDNQAAIQTAQRELVAMAIPIDAESYRANGRNPDHLKWDIRHFLKQPRCPS